MRKAKEEKQEIKELVLSPLNTQKLARFSLEFELLEQKVAVQQLLRDALISKIDPHGALAKLDAKIRELTRNYHQARQKYEEVRKDVGQEMEIDISKFSYDDESGILHEITLEETPPPTKE